MVIRYFGRRPSPLWIPALIVTSMARAYQIRRFPFIIEWEAFAVNTIDGRGDHPHPQVDSVMSCPFQ